MNYSPLVINDEENLRRRSIKKSSKEISMY